MTTLMIPVEIPISALVTALGPDIERAIRQMDKEKPPAKRRAPPATLLEATRLLTEAVTRLENSRGTRDEPRAQANLNAAAHGVRTAYFNFKNPIKGKQP